ncbi:MULTISPECIES: excinuclease ABC subunit UvrC [Robiginitalea]|uniref:excinuclease ABC subunit UvrC n=1 Tax=Robiginitalea TaxID=252306 RepID=UPI00234A43E7|nr:MULTISPECIES: excinuclease ABC subunit UvrC [unclassified Robiginitalea]MDC6353001.1 excinuclease ABC subunit UvrC [Robiginitalea sp. PM2]MDC6373832.1 excinuclease ABC subunit UvrC [Robiginitalea sp. SP8]
MSQTPLEIQLKTLPESPGVYQFYDADQRMLYVGKAKNLKKRVGSYFTKKHDSGKTRVLVKKIRSIRHIVVPTESDALLLENNLIKEHQPRYNVLLRDDKSYPWLCIKNERFPRIFPTRNRIEDGSEYFGPYTSMKTVRALLELIRSVYPLRTCNYDLAAEKIRDGKYKVCLEYHLGNCLGPCEGLQDEASYMRQVDDIRQIIRGNFGSSLQYFRRRMKQLAGETRFEEAQQIKEKVEILENYQSKSTVVHPKITDVDVFSIVSDPTHAYVNYMQIAHGLVVRSHTIEIKKKLEESDEDLLALAIVTLRERFGSDSGEVYLPFEVPVAGPVRVTVPSRGDKRKIVELSLRNAKFFRQERFKQIRITDPDRHVNRLMEQMKKDLRLSEEPRHIECFDNSNIQGSNPVAACVVFRDGKPSKKEYRHFNIRTVEGPDDFASMTEVVHRRYRRMLDQGDSLPQLIVVDGGKGQLSAALKSLDVLGLRGTIAIIGIAKRLEEIYFPKDPIPLYLDKKSETLRVIQQLRNEAHRFGITHHRKKRSKAAISSALEQIDGVGEKTARQLLRKFKSVKRIRAASEAELAAEVGPSKARKIYESLRE